MLLSVRSTPGPGRASTHKLAMPITATILFVGHDFCARTDVLASVGYRVIRCESDADAVQSALTENAVDAVLFQCEPEPPSHPIIATARSLSRAPLILFAGNSIYNPRDFDVLLESLCSPREWLCPLAAAIASYQNPEHAKPPQSQPADTTRTRRYNQAR